MERRDFLKNMCYGWIATFGFPIVRFAHVPWNDTTVVVMTEFGRTARPNGTRGTDHGTAGAGFVIGSKVARSLVMADWPDLSDGALYEGRDVKPTLDIRVRC